MTVEACPHCGKPFKRLKSHLPHCKLTPLQHSHALQDPQDPPKHTQNIEKQKKSSTRTSITITGKPPSKWLARRQKELEKQSHASALPGQSKVTVRSSLEILGEKKLDAATSLQFTVFHVNNPGRFQNMSDEGSSVRDDSTLKSDLVLEVAPKTPKSLRNNPPAGQWTEDVPSTVKQPDEFQSSAVKASISRWSSVGESSVSEALGWSAEIIPAYRTLLSRRAEGHHHPAQASAEHPFPRTSAAREVPLVERRLGDVQLRELPVWAGSRMPTSPRTTVRMLKQGWQWYYRKYIDVRKGGLGGVSMLLTGYCVLCYIWSFSHLKQERWRKYH